MTLISQPTMDLRKKGWDAVLKRLDALEDERAFEVQFRVHGQLLRSLINKVEQAMLQRVFGPLKDPQNISKLQGTLTRCQQTSWQALEVQLDISTRFGSTEKFCSVLEEWKKRLPTQDWEMKGHISEIKQVCVQYCRDISDRAQADVLRHYPGSAKPHQAHFEAQRDIDISEVNHIASLAQLLTGSFPFGSPVV
jgi:hypothetical protein